MANQIPAKSGDNTLNILTHVLALIAGFIGPLIILLAARNEATKKHSRNALNWQISYIIYIIISLVLMLVVIGFVLFIALIIMNLIFCIIAAVKAGEGKLWDYPLAIRFLRN